MTKLSEYLDVSPSPLMLAPGRILISSPFYNDSFFNHSVVLLIDHEPENGAMGFILNHETENKVEEFADTCNIQAPIFIGGPVTKDSLYVIHNFEKGTDFDQVLPNLYYGFNHLFLSVLEHHVMPQLKYRFFLGYAGWVEDQLENEIFNKMWIVGQADMPFILNTPSDKMWETAVRSLGKEYAHWLNFPKNLSDN